MWHKLLRYRWSWLGIAVWLLLGLLAGVMWEQWYQDLDGGGDGADGDGTAAAVELVRS